MATGDVNLLREKLDEIADLYPDDIELQDLVAQAHSLTRRSRVKLQVARATAKGEDALTDDEIKRIIRFSWANPTMSNRAVGRMFGCDGGRVSEFCGTKKTDRLVRLREEVRNGL